MSYLELKERAKSAILKALEKIGIKDVKFDVLEPTVEGIGEVTTNVAFTLSKKLKRPPIEMAKEIVGNMEIDPWFKKIEAHPKGYINFWLSYLEYGEALFERVLIRENYGKLDVGRGRKVVIEHTSVNPNKALHIGHARNVVIGDTIGRLMKRAGYNVSILNYIDDTGTQVADVLVGFLYLGFKKDVERKFDQYCGDVVYIEVNKRFEEDPSLIEKRREIIKQLEVGGPIAEVAREIIDRIVREQLKTCWRLGAEYDLLNWESHILRSGYWNEVFSMLKKRDLVEFVKDGKYKGCWVLKGGEGDEKVLVRSDGTTVYAAKDIPYAAWKLGIIEDRFGYEVFAIQPSGKELWTTKPRRDGKDHPIFNNGDIAITVIDVRQSRVQNFVKLAVKGIGGEGKEYMHLGYEVVALSKDTVKELGMLVKEDKEFYHMSGRKGVYVNVDDILDELKKRAIEESKTRNPEEDEEWLNDVGEKIAVGALRYALLKQDLDKIIVFDIKEAMKLEGDTGPYLQYSLARAIRILEKAGGWEFERGLAKYLDEEEERKLVLLLSKYENAMLEAIVNFSPKRLVKYVRELAVAFNSFYEKCPVLQEEDVIRRARLALVATYVKILSDALQVLGIPILERL